MRVLSGRWLARFAAVIIVATVWALAAPGTPSAEAQTCLTDMTASNETELAFAIGCYNTNAIPNNVYTIAFTQDIVLSSALPMLDKNSTAILELDGAGFTLNANNAVSDALSVNTGILEVDDLTITGATDDGFENLGGFVSVTGSTITGNAFGVNSGGGTFTMRNSTVFGNTQWGVRAKGNVAASLIESSTIVDNGSLGLVVTAGDPNLTMSDSVVANNATGDCDQLVGNDGGGNLFGDNTCNGTATAALRATLAAGLAPNGCVQPCTDTLALLPGSPAVDTAGTCNVSVDQRGVARTAGSCDAGAFELGDCLANSTVGDETELAFAIGCFNTGAVPNTVTTITLTQDIVLSAPLPGIDKSSTAILELSGAGFTLDADGVVLDALSILNGIVEIDALTVTGATDDGIDIRDGFVTITGSTITANEYGINAWPAGAVTLRNSTVFGNVNWGVFVQVGAIIESSTIVDNGGVGIEEPALATVTDSLVANNSDGDCDALLGTDGGGNLFGDATCNGTSTADLRTTLAADLALNGCTAPCTKTLALLPGSPAVDAAGICDVSVDQRGVARTAGSCDSGAFEFGDCAAAFSVADQTELAFAIGCFNSALASSVTTITLTQDIVLSSALTAIDSSSTAILELDGAGFTLDADGVVDDALFILNGSVEIDDLTVTGAKDDGIDIRDGFVTIAGSTITENDYGINASPAGAVTLRNSTVFGNVNWGVFVQVGAIIESSTIVDNGGAGIDFAALATVTDSLVANNGDGDCEVILGSDGGGNLFGDTTCNGSAEAGLRTTLAADLALNGCTAPCTKTLALLPGSPAVDAAGICDVSVDQRGVARTAGSCDSGAFEFGDLLCNGTPVTISAVAGVVTTGTSGNDVILGTDGPDVINSLGGDDLICALAGDDVVDAGDGNDTVFADAGLDTVVGGNGNDTLWGGPDRDIMRGGPDVDVLHGEGGDDRLLGGIGGDTLNGGDGDDYLGGFGGGDTINGGPGNETIFGGFGADIIDGGPGNDEIFGLIGNDTIMGGPGDDKLNGDRGNDTIEGGPGNDIIRGGNANDVLRGDAGDDSVSGGKADDSLSGGDDIDVCVGNLQNVADTADATCETIFGVP